MEPAFRPGQGVWSPAGFAPESIVNSAISDPPVVIFFIRIFGIMTIAGRDDATKRGPTTRRGCAFARPVRQGRTGGTKDVDVIPLSEGLANIISTIRTDMPSPATSS